MFPESMKSFIDMASIIGDLQKRVERLETLEAANIGGLCDCWCPLGYDVGPGSLEVDNIPDHSPPYSSLALLYAIVHDDVNVIHDITLELNNISTATYESIYFRMDNNIGAGLGNASEVITATAQNNIVVGKAPPDNIGIKKASGVIFFPYSQQANTPVIAINACYNDQATAGSRLSAGIYFGDNSGYLGALTKVELDVPASFIKVGSWMGLYEICYAETRGGGG